MACCIPYTLKPLKVAQDHLFLHVTLQNLAFQDTCWLLGILAQIYSINFQAILIKFTLVFIKTCFSPCLLPGLSLFMWPLTFCCLVHIMFDISLNRLFETFV